MERKGGGKVPVFVFPTTLNFYLGARETHKQMLTIYNPYDFPVRFQVLCTAPHKYTVIDPDGSIRPQCCVDIVIRYIMPIAVNCNATDRFRITMLDHSTKQILGKREITSKLIQGEPDNISSEGIDFQPMPTFTGQKIENQKNMNYTLPSIPSDDFPFRSHPTNYIAIVTGLVCIFALFLPTKQESPEPTSVPAYLHVSIHLKLIFAYVLGLVSMVVLKP